MRKRGRTDSNQAEIVKVLRSWGMSVQPISGVGGGVPDLAVGHKGRTFLLECKDGTKPPSGKRLTKEEADWHARWTGHAAIVESPAEALCVVLRLTRGL